MKLLVLLSVIALAAAAAKFEFLEEWETWKEQHGKGYQSEREELERHLIWLSTKKYIDQHNANSDIFGYTLAINHFADLVSEVSNVAVAIGGCIATRRRHAAAKSINYDVLAVRLNHTKSYAV